MIQKMIIAIGVVFAVCGLWFWLQQKGRDYAQKHPEFGRFREEGGECGKTCGCADWKHCMKKQATIMQRDPTDQPDQTHPSDETNIYKTSTKESS